jgi:O-acetylhomoserine (thiol)-lyase
LECGRFPEFTEPNEGYQGLVYHEALGAAALLLKLEYLRDYGAALSPFNAFKLFKDLNISRSCQETQRKWIGFSSMVRKSRAVAW